MVLIQEESPFRKRVRRYLDDGICLIVILLMPLVLLWPTWVRGDLPIGTQSVLAFAPWEEARPPGLLSEVNPESNLAAQRYYPWFAFLSRAGEFRDILWDPLEGCGLPFLALWRTRCLSPFSLPYYLFEVGFALQCSVFAKLLVAGLCALYAARKLGFARPISLFVSLVFQMSGPMTLWCGYPLSDVVPWVPLIVLFCERLALGQPRLWAQGSLVIALLLLGGDPEAAAGIVLFGLVYLVLRFLFGLRPPREWVVPFSTFLTAIAVAQLLAAVQILPYIEFLRQAAEDGRVPAAYFPRFNDLLALFLPCSGGGQSAGALAGSDSLRVAALLHAGLVPVLLLPLWLSIRKYASARQRHRVESLLLAVALATALAFLAGPLVRHYPFISRLNPEHYLTVYALAMALVAAATLEEWLHLNAQDCMSALKRFLLFGPVFGALVVILMATGRGQSGPTIGAYGWKLILDGFIVIVVLAVLGATALKPSVRLLGYSLCGLTALDLFLACGLGMSFTDRDLVFPETPFINLFKQSEGRVGGSDALSRWPLAGNSIPQVYGAAGVSLKRHADFQSRIGDDPLLLRRAGTPSLLLAKEDIQGKFAAVRPLLRFEKIFPSGAVLFQDLEAKPYAWMAYTGRSVEKYDITMLSSEQPPLMEQVTPPQPIANPPSPNVEVKRESTTRAVIRVPSTPPGVLIQADAWYPGWEATVNGKPAKLFPVDVLFRGIEVPQGPVEVTVTYDPLSVKIGAAVSIISGALVLLSFQSALRHSWREARQRRRWRR